MKASVRDVSTLRALKPLEVVSYLRSAGWKKVKEKQNLWSLWIQTSADGDEFEIALPLDHSLRDFAQRMADALTVLEVAEERSQLEILRDLFVSSADLIRVSLAGSELVDGSVPIDDGAQVFQRARDLMLAAACAAAGPKAYFPSRKPNQATEYLRKVRLGQTEQGSFVVTIISRVAPSLTGANGTLFEQDEPFARRVTHTLANAVAAVRSAAAEAASTGNVESFIDVVPKGVSANLCDAIVGLAGTSEGSRDIEFGFTWSRSRPLEAGERLPREIALPMDSIPVIEEAARYFKIMSPREEFEVCGPVVKLERGEGEPMGRVTVLTFVDEQPRKVTLQLVDPEYHEAVNAHDQQRVVQCFGVLKREGRAFRLDDVYGFSIDGTSEE